MFSFKEMRLYARKVDEGIEYLSNRISDPCKLSLVTEESANVAAATIEEIGNELNTRKDSINTHVQKEYEDINEIKDEIQNIEDLIHDVYLDLQDLETQLTSYGYSPYRKRCSNDVSEINKDTLDKVQFDNPAENRLLLDESPVFTTPNYNSTPDTSLQSANQEKQSSSFRKLLLTPRLNQWSKSGVKFNRNKNVNKNL
ncbi:uncharacterized protein LOC142329900 [Lycorma delicatula]|uniref:uncharacterized protein LOC142329900 n=1 Tax=Lycorma delicatula TaxID=130591 RepID=UPI003F5150AD